MDTKELQRIKERNGDLACNCGHKKSTHNIKGHLHLACDTRDCNCRRFRGPNRDEVLDKAKMYVWHISQVPSSETFFVPVESSREAAEIITLLAEYDLFQFEQNIKGDYTNASGLMEWDGDEWCEWINDDGDDIEYCIQNGVEL